MRRKVPTKHNHFGDEVHFNTVVEHFSDPLQRGRVIQPHVRKNKEIDVRKLLLDPNCVSRLSDTIASTQSEYIKWRAAYVFLWRRRSLPQEVYMSVNGSGSGECGSQTQ